VLFPKKNSILFVCVILFVGLIVFLSCQTSVYTVRSSVVDISKFPLFVTTFLSHEARAVILFHQSYWQNIKLRQDNEALKLLVIHDNELSAENERLRKLFDLKSKADYSTIVSRVIGKDTNSFRPYLILDKGRSSGVKKYSTVMTPLGLLGKVLEVGFYSSKVILVNDPDLSIPAINTRSREQGLVSGSLDGRCKLRFLDINSDIKIGDEILTSGLNMTYPEGILIGSVKFVGTESSGMGKFAILEPAVNVSGVDEVLIVK
jgi:rod shape-determining protein MreC